MELPDRNSNEPVSEQYRLKAKEFNRLDLAAKGLEEGKSIWLSREMKKLGDMPVTSAEREVKSSRKYQDYVTAMLKARSAANEVKEEMAYLRMRHSELQSYEANKRAEMKL